MESLSRYQIVPHHYAAAAAAAAAAGLGFVVAGYVGFPTLGHGVREVHCPSQKDLVVVVVGSHDGSGPARVGHDGRHAHLGQINRVHSADQVDGSDEIDYERENVHVHEHEHEHAEVEEQLGVEEYGIRSVDVDADDAGRQSPWPWQRRG